MSSHFSLLAWCWMNRSGTWYRPRLIDMTPSTILELCYRSIFSRASFMRVYKDCRILSSFKPSGIFKTRRNSHIFVGYMQLLSLSSDFPSNLHLSSMISNFCMNRLCIYYSCQVVKQISVRSFHVRITSYYERKFRIIFNITDELEIIHPMFNLIT